MAVSKLHWYQTENMNWDSAAQISLATTDGIATQVRKLYANKGLTLNSQAEKQDLTAKQQPFPKLNKTVCVPATVSQS